MMRMLLRVVLSSLLGAGVAQAQLSASAPFNPANSGSLCGFGFSSTTESVWVYGCSEAEVERYTATGGFQSQVPRPGESANDVDVELAPAPLTLGVTPVAGGSVLFVNGESGVADIYAVDPVTGSVLGSLTTAFGVSHVVGGAYHPSRNTFFLVQDNVPAAADENRIAEIDPATGAVLNTFQITATFSVNFGDIDVCASSGNLFVASDDETDLAEYTPTGAFVQYHPLPVGVSALSGLGIHDASGAIWVSGTSGNVWKLTGPACAGIAPVSALPPSPSAARSKTA